MTQLSKRQLDEAVAVAVMGYCWIVINRRRKNLHSPSGQIVAYVEGKEISYTGYGKPSLPEFSVSIEDAMQVVEKMRQRGWSFACTLYEGKLPYASFCKGSVKSSRNAEADSLPTAICMAALAAIEES